MSENNPGNQKHFLDGVVILDVTNVLAGPFTTYLLTLMGARTIKVEHVKGGDLARSLGASRDLSGRLMGASFIAQNAGKESIALDLKSERGKEIFRRLAAKSDVVVENFRPGVMDRLGLGYRELKRVRPDVIYCAISGYGQDGPDASSPAYDQIIQGKSGLMSVTGTEDSGPLRCGVPIADTVGGLNAAFAVASALYSRSVTGRGACLDVSLLDSIMPMMGWVASNLLLAGVEPVRMGNENFTAAPSGAFETRTGLLNISANQEGQWRRLCELLELHDLPQDPRFSDRDRRKQNRYVLRDILNDKLRERPAEEWAELFNEAGVPAGVVLTLDAALSQPQARRRETIKSINDPELGELKVFGLPLKVKDVQDLVPPPPPRLGQQTDSILAELGYSPEDIDRMEKNQEIKRAGFGGSDEPAKGK